MKTKIATGTFGAIVFFSLATRGMPSDCGPKSGVTFQIVTDKSAYAPRSTMHVKFIVTNIGGSPFHLSRHLNECGSPVGFASLQILDQNNQDVRGSGCSDDIGPVKDSEIIEVVTDAKFWIVLQPREIYGGEASFDLSAKKGTYRLKAELFPTSFTEKQREILSQKKMRVLLCPCSAPAVTVTVR